MARNRHARRAQVLASPARLRVIALEFSLVYGTVGFVVLEGFSPLNALYMTVTTLTTVGFGEIEPLGPPGPAVRRRLRRRQPVAPAGASVRWRRRTAR